ncbi:hypothetical protein [Ornithinimicrobium sp. Y1694]|uniref:hypothetical protein n=1 Tax=Ornithinimicrobium sp. Y1694 TaxID=3418590 RepID=UPI003CF80ACF
MSETHGEPALMTAQDAAAGLQRAARTRRRFMLWGVLAIAVFASLLTSAVFIWFFDEPWHNLLISSAVFILVAVLFGWWISSSDSALKNAASTEQAVSAELTQVDDRRVTVRVHDGTLLTWSIRSPRTIEAEAGQQLWLSTPAAKGEHIVAMNPGAVASRGPRHCGRPRSRGLTAAAEHNARPVGEISDITRARWAKSATSRAPGGLKRRPHARPVG